jgi:hypothetical protein
MDDGERQLMIADPDLADPVTAEYYTTDDLDRAVSSDLGVVLPDDAVIPRYGYCSECGWMSGLSGRPPVMGTMQQVYDALTAEFAEHRCCDY